MNLDIISTQYANLTFNVKLAHIVGLEAAIYWSALSDVSYQVKKKNKFDENGFFKLDRKYIIERTTLGKAKQKECDEILYLAGLVILDKDDPDQIAVNTNAYIDLIREDEEKVIDTVKEKVRAIKNRSAEVARTNWAAEGIKKRITETDLDIRQGLFDWVDALGGKINVKAAELFIEKLNSYTSKKDVKLKLLEIATVTAYRDFDWVKNAYERKTGQTVVVKDLGQQKVASSLHEINLDKKF